MVIYTTTAMHGIHDECTNPLTEKPCHGWDGLHLLSRPNTYVRKSSIIHILPGKHYLNRVDYVCISAPRSIIKWGSVLSDTCKRVLTAVVDMCLSFNRIRGIPGTAATWSLDSAVSCSLVGCGEGNPTGWKYFLVRTRYEDINEYQSAGSARHKRRRTP